MSTTARLTERPSRSMGAGGNLTGVCPPCPRTSWLGWLPLIGQLLTAGVSHAQPTPLTSYDEQIADLEARVIQDLRRERVAGLALALIDDQRVVWAQGFGYRDARRRIPVTSQTRFQTGDMTKLFTTIAVLQQIQQGRYTLDTGIDKLLPDLRIDTRFPELPPPTVRQLLSHLGGLPSNRFAGSYAPRATDRLRPVASIFIAQPSGGVYAYSDLGYALLGHVIERQSGLRYTAYMQRYVFGPLNMSGASFQPDASSALGHSRGGQVRPDTFVTDLSALGLQASVLDMASAVSWFLRADHEPVLAGGLVTQMSEVQNEGVVLDLDQRTGLAWHLTNTGRHTTASVLRMNAATMHFRGLLLLAPEEKVGVVLLANSAAADELVLNTGRYALDSLLAAKVGAARPASGKEVPAHIPLHVNARPDPMQPRYATPLGTMSFVGLPERYEVAFLGRGFSALRRDDGWYRLAYRLFGLFDLSFAILDEILFQPAIVAERHVLLAYYRDRIFLFGSLLQDGQANSRLAHLVGRYRVANPDTLIERLEIDRIDLEYQDGLLYASYRLPILFTLRPRMPLREVRPGELIVEGIGTNLGDRLTYDSDTGHILYSGYTLEKY